VRLAVQDLETAVFGDMESGDALFLGSNGSLRRANIQIPSAPVLFGGFDPEVSR
jgi:hypothetical protein